MSPAPETILLFHEDPYRREAPVRVTALVADARFGPCLVLGETLCHPHGGGQKGDRGRLVLPPQAAGALGVPALSIGDTRRDGARILHLLAPDGPPPDAVEAVLAGGPGCTLELDWPFRFTQMRLHSAAHLLHCFVARQVGGHLEDPETSDLQPDFGLNRYGRPDLLDGAGLDAAVEAMNRFTAQGHAIRTRSDAGRDGFRYWECGEWVIPCGGTHPRDSAQIGPITARLSLKRGRTSMTFRLDGE